MLFVHRNPLIGRYRVARVADPRQSASHARLGEPCYRQRAFTLLEVILAIAILAAALAALGEVVRLSGENANAARDLSRAQLLAASKIAEIASGAVQLTTVPRTALDIEADPPWVYQVDLTDTIAEGLIAVHVTVEQDRPEVEQPIRFQLVRWMPDPGALPESTDSGSSTSGSSSTGGGSTSTGGSSPSTGESGGR